MRYFAYGTLLDPDVRTEVLGAETKKLRETPAILWGYRCVGIAGVTFPTLRRDPGARVDGLIFDGVDGAIACRLADYEGDEYAARFVGVHTPSGLRLWSRCFMARRRPAGGRSWDFALWQRRHKSAFMRRLRD